ncbi:hypothetical protein [Helicobacter felis]|nr:hypothetical protein [Helicobacter felis]
MDSNILVLVGVFRKSSMWIFWLVVAGSGKYVTFTDLMAYLLDG